MKLTGWYNGYDWKERNAKLKELKLRVASGEQEPAKAHCGATLTLGPILTALQLHVRTLGWDTL